MRSAGALWSGHPHSLIGLEDLTHIRERTKRKHGKKARESSAKPTGTPLTWAFAQLHGFLAYKALLAGRMAVKVDADYTSQACPKCGYTCEANRPNKGLLFECQNCQYTSPCRFDRCAKRCDANAAPPARLDEHGRLVGTPRGLVPGYVGP